MRFVETVLTCAIVSVSTGLMSMASNESTPRKVLVVLVYDESCKLWCGAVRPIMRDLRTAYGETVEFTELDCSKSVLPEAKKRAGEMGIGKYIADAQDYIPEVLVFDARRKDCKELVGPKKADAYRAAIDRALAAK